MVISHEDIQQKDAAIIAIFAYNFVLSIVQDGTRRAYNKVIPPVRTKHEYVAARKRDFRMGKASSESIPLSRLIHECEVELADVRSKAKARATIVFKPKADRESWDARVFERQTMANILSQFSMNKEIVMTTTKVDLTGQLIGNAGLESFLCPYIQCLRDALVPALKVLVLTNNNIDDNGMRQLSDVVIQLMSLQELYLNNNMITDDGVEYLFNPSRYAGHLQLINLSRNKLTKTSAYFIGLMFTNKYDSKLQDLIIGDNPVTQNGKTKALGDEFICVLVDFLTCPGARHIRKLYCPSAGLTDIGMGAITALITYSTRLESLNVTRNYMAYEDTKRALRLAIETSNSLREIHIQQCGFSRWQLQQCFLGQKQRNVRLTWDDSLFLSKQCLESLSCCDDTRMKLENAIVNIRDKPPPKDAALIPTRLARATMGSNRMDKSRDIFAGLNAFTATPIPVYHPRFQTRPAPTTESVFVAAMEAALAEQVKQSEDMAEILSQHHRDCNSATTPSSPLRRQRSLHSSQSFNGSHSGSIKVSTQNKTGIGSESMTSANNSVENKSDNPPLETNIIPVIKVILTQFDIFLPTLQLAEDTMIISMAECVRDNSLYSTHVEELLKGRSLFEDIQRRARSVRAMMQLILNKYHSQQRAANQSLYPENSALNFSKPLANIISLEMVLMSMEEYGSYLKELLVLAEINIAKTNKIRIECKKVNTQLCNYLCYADRLGDASYYAHYYHSVEPIYSKERSAKVTTDLLRHGVYRSVASLATPPVSESVSGMTTPSISSRKSSARRGSSTLLLNLEKSRDLLSIAAERSNEREVSLPPVEKEPTAESNKLPSNVLEAVAHKEGGEEEGGGKVLKLRAVRPPAKAHTKVKKRWRDKYGVGVAGTDLVDSASKTVVSVTPPLAPLPPLPLQQSVPVLSISTTSTAPPKDMMPAPALAPSAKARTGPIEKVSSLESPTMTPEAKAELDAINLPPKAYRLLYGKSPPKKATSKASTKKVSKKPKKRVIPGLLSVFESKKFKNGIDISNTSGKGKDENLSLTAYLAKPGLGRRDRGYLIRSGSTVISQVLPEQEEDRSSFIPIANKLNFFRNTVRLEMRFTSSLADRKSYYENCDVDFL